MHQKLRLKDYQEPAYFTEKVHLEFEIASDKTTVKGALDVKKNPKGNGNQIVLNGDGQKILSLKINGDAIDASKYLKEKDLIIPLSCENCEIEIVNEISPEANLSGEGLYMAGKNLLTQCEAEGFRKILYYQDRPDVLAKFTTKIIADKKYKTLLSNGNLISQEDIDETKSMAIWEDPFPKPSYLFALVCGDYDKIEDHFKTLDNREILLEIYVDPGSKDKAYHAMKSLKEAMKWDEDRFQLIYDLDRYMVVATNQFNSGAMENKGLNIFNSKYVLADKETATDQDFYNIQAVVGHEYFHNWTGNRVTCRDWFQLSLKEGLTVFRDQEFSSDLNSRAVKRIDDVITLKRVQFAEDQGPNAHPVRPEEAYSISNFYTATIYEKGAELIRMIHTLIGEEAFQKGMQTYFDLYDGKAVTTEDFCHAMEEASGKDLSHFKKWYSQKGTPKVSIEKKESTNGKLKLVFKQITSPLTIPFKIGFIDNEGNELTSDNTSSSAKHEWRDKDLLLEIKNEKEELEIDLPSNTNLSLLRDFSAPIDYDYKYSNNELKNIAKFDKNPYSKWAAKDSILKDLYIKSITATKEDIDIAELSDIFEIYQESLKTSEKDLEFTSLILQPMEYSTISLAFDTIPLDEYFRVDEKLNEQVSLNLKHHFEKHYKNLIKKDSPEARKLKNTLLFYLTNKDPGFAIEQYKKANNMTDSMAALKALIQNKNPEAFELLDDFYQKWKDDQLTISKFFALKFSYPEESILEDLKTLKNTVFNEWNPNHNYSVYGALSMRNPEVFHSISGKTYKKLLSRIIELDKKNPSIASNLATAFKEYPRLDAKRKAIIHDEIKGILDKEDLSTNTFERLKQTIS